MMTKTETRKYWVDTMLKIVHPVIFNLSNDQLKISLPIEGKKDKEMLEKCTYLEAIGRSLVGFAPWLECTGLSAEEESLRLKYAKMTRKAISNAVNPLSADYLYNEVNQANKQILVDTAFLAHAMLRAPKELWEKFDDVSKQNIINAMKQTRILKPPDNNWLLFAAMVEAFLFKIGEPEWDQMRIDYAVKQHDQWYKGDGIYGDGFNFHFDYYNSFVIQPMLVDIIDTVNKIHRDWDDLKIRIVARAQRYAEILEMLISPEGYYPVIGRSAAYRFGAFQTLSQIALQNRLTNITYEQVRCALTKLIQNVMLHDNFDKDGWLKIGVCGYQPDMGDYYVSIGSLYLCSAIFLPLGLSPDHPFWSGDDKKWTSQKIWGGENVQGDHAITV